MTITKQQFADLLNGLGSSYASSGGYAGQRSLLTIGAILEALADEILENPTETYEIPPARIRKEPTVSYAVRKDGDDRHVDIEVSGAKSVKVNVSDSVEFIVTRTGDNDWSATVDARNRIGETDVRVIRNGDGPL